jgi:hypothetical protein
MIRVFRRSGKRYLTLTCEKNKKLKKYEAAYVNTALRLLGGGFRFFSSYIRQKEKYYLKKYGSIGSV